jgi:cytochrome b subunit of formate dehydrogenase
MLLTKQIDAKMEKKMSKSVRMSRQTRTNWLIDVAVFAGALLAALSGIYFLFVPSGGYQGGRNPWYGITILFSRHTWDDLHTWGGVLMIVAVVVHFGIHWDWVKMMSRRVVNAARSRGSKLSTGAKINVLTDLVIAISFVLCAVSGVVFLFAPSGGFQGGANLSWDPGFLFSRATWDIVHTWSGVALIVSAVIHFAIHWRWVKNVTHRFFLSLWPRQGLKQAPVGR